MAEGLVIIPTYNEIENIERIIRAVFELPKAYDILVVDDSFSGWDGCLEFRG